MNEYVHIFRDQTSNGILSGNIIPIGANTAGNTILAGAGNTSVFGKLGGQVGNIVLQKAIEQPINQVTGGFGAPVIRVVKAAFTSTSLAAFGAVAGGAGIMLAVKGLQVLWQKHQEKIAKLESEAQAANDKDNLMIRSGSLNISGANVSYGRYGRAQYKFDRS